MLGGPAAARASSAGAAGYLQRAAYTPLVGQRFRVGGHLMTLAEVADLAGVSHDTDLRDHPDAFALQFDGGAGALEAGIHEFSHPDLGSFALYLTPVGLPDGAAQRYEVVVDRSVRGRPRPAEPTNEPSQAAAEAPSTTASSSTASPAQGATPAKKPAKRVRRKTSARLKAASRRRRLAAAKRRRRLARRSRR
jgi:hypothetical protein